MAVAPATKQGSDWRRAAAVRDALAIALAVGTGSLDAISFLALGSVFVSVMTGDLVLLGIAARRGNAALSWHVALAFAGYAAGVSCGTLIAGQPADEQPAWPATVTRALLAELAVLAAPVIAIVILCAVLATARLLTRPGRLLTRSKEPGA